MRPNILMVVLDTVRADALEPYGAPPGASPALADLARAGRALPDARSTACWTVPAHASMFTGMLPRAIGLSLPPDGRPQGCRPVMEAHRHRVLPEVLRRAGYRTRGISTNLWVTDQSGFATGFDDFEVVRTTRQPDMVGNAWARAAWMVDALRARSDDGAAEAGRLLRTWLGDRDPRRPEFWFVNLLEAHSPYLPPRPWNPLGALDRLRAAAEARRHLTLGEIWRNCISTFTIPDEALDRMRRLYAAAVRQLDDWVAAVLDAVDLDDTLVIVCSDHGENLGDGGLIGHAYSLDDRLTHVPFLTAGPGAPRDLRTLAELPRAVAAAAEIADHPWREELPEAAVSQFDAVVGDRDHPRVVAAAAEWGLDDAARDRLVTSFECAAAGNLKLVRRSGALELYDLERDPLELAPERVAADDAPAQLVAALDHPMGRRAAVQPSAPVAVDSEDVERLEKQMRTLGYL